VSLSSRSFLVVAGESSGDAHAAELIRHLRGSLSDYSLFGLGGDKLIAQGLQPLFHVSDMQVTGFVEVAKRYSFFRNVLRRTVAEVRTQNPAFAILVDYPGFNLRLARFLHEVDIPVYYYIAPQMWAWREGRVRFLRRFVKKLIVLFPFEQIFFSKRGVSTEYYGHPLGNRLEAGREKRLEAAKKIIGNDRRRIIAYLPGSRQNEVKPHLEELKGLARQLGDGYRHIIARAGSPSLEFIERGFSDEGLFEVVDSSEGLLEAADVGIIKSGTSTLQTAMIGTPFVVIYKASPITYLLGRSLAKVKHISIVNILADKLVVPELIQGDLTAENLWMSINDILFNEDRKEEMIGHFREIMESLRGDDPYRDAANSIIESLA